VCCSSIHIVLHSFIGKKMKMKKNDRLQKAIEEGRGRVSFLLLLRPAET
jgi:hypothetical protein